MYWTSRSTVAFNFTGFLDYETRVQRYQWGIGSKPYSADAVPLTDVTASRVLKDIKYAGGTQKMFVTPVVSKHQLLAGGLEGCWCCSSSATASNPAAAAATCQHYSTRPQPQATVV